MCQQPLRVSVPVVIVPFQMRAAVEGLVGMGLFFVVGGVGGMVGGISGASFERGGSQELFSGSVKGVGLQPDEEMCRTTGMHGEVVGSNTTDSSQDCLQLLHRDPRFICAMALL